MYTTNQPQIVEHARYCYENFPTIVNNIPKDQNKYNNTMDDFARVDSNLAKSQTDIGESSNLAQIAQSYMYSFTGAEYEKCADYVCILSVVAQIAIDSSKRAFDVNVAEEIKRIKADLNVKENKYPAFWAIIKRDFKKRNINKDLQCPMNYLANLSLYRFRNNSPTLPMNEFFVRSNIVEDRKQNKRRCKKVEQLIENYSLNLFNSRISNEYENEDYLLLRSDFEKLVTDIRETYISKNYTELMSWLIDRAFEISPYVKGKNTTIKTNLDKNKTLLLKTLYAVNPECFINCFKKGEF